MEDIKKNLPSPWLQWGNFHFLSLVSWNSIYWPSVDIMSLWQYLNAEFRRNTWDILSTVGWILYGDSEDLNAVLGFVAVVFSLCIWTSHSSSLEYSSFICKTKEFTPIFAYGYWNWTNFSFRKYSWLNFVVLFFLFPFLPIFFCSMKLPCVCVPRNSFI
jgi:hypothetical protein